MQAEYLSSPTQSQHVLLICFPLQKWLQERASMLRYTYLAFLVKIFLNIRTKPRDGRTNKATIAYCHIPVTASVLGEPTITLAIESDSYKV